MTGCACGVAIWAMLFNIFFVNYLQIASLEIAHHLAGVLTNDTVCIVWHFYNFELV